MAAPLAVRACEPAARVLSTAPVAAAAASNDVCGVRWAVEHDGAHVDAPGDWYTPVSRAGGETLERKRRTPLMIAAAHGSLDVLSYLLSVGADLSVRSDDDDACTALHCAAAGGSAQAAEAIKTLLLFGAERDARDAAGRRAADLLPVREPLAERLLGASPPQPGAAAGLSCGGLHLGGPSAPGAHGAATAANGLSDLDHEAFATDAFKMYEFKVRRCTKTRAHDWTECPFMHPGEKARRRDPRRFAYCGTACPDFRKGSCRRGDACGFAHGVFECWLHPARYRTQSCKDGPACTRRVCFFAHLPGELRAPTDPFGAGEQPHGCGSGGGGNGHSGMLSSSSRGNGAASPTGHPLPHSPSQASSASPPRSASPPQPADTFADLAAYGLLPHAGRPAAPPLHGRRVASMDGGSRAVPANAGYYGAGGYSNSAAAAAAAAAAERQLAHLNLAAGQANMRLGSAAAVAAAAAAAAAAQQQAASVAVPTHHVLISAQQAAYAAAAGQLGLASGQRAPQPRCAAAPPPPPLGAGAYAAGGAAAVAAAQLAQAQLAQQAVLAQQAAAMRAVAQQRAAAAALHTHLAAAAAAVSLAGAADVPSYAAPPPPPPPQQQHAAKGPTAALRAAAAAASAAFPRPSSFAHLGMIEGVLDVDDDGLFPTGGAGSAFAPAWAPPQEAAAATTWA